MLSGIRAYAKRQYSEAENKAKKASQDACLYGKNYLESKEQIPKGVLGAVFVPKGLTRMQRNRA